MSSCSVYFMGSLENKELGRVGGINKFPGFEARGEKSGNRGRCSVGGAREIGVTFGHMRLGV